MCSLSLFITFCENHPEKIFYLTKIGCGIAGWSIYEVAAIFFDALEHVAEMSNGLVPLEEKAMESCSEWGFKDGTGSGLWCN